LLNYSTAFINGVAIQVHCTMSNQPPQDYAQVSTPDPKSSREAELEELRRQNLAQSNAQKLGTFSNRWIL
jgi:hypothetical protein